MVEVHTEVAPQPVNQEMGRWQHIRNSVGSKLAPLAIAAVGLIGASLPTAQAEATVRTAPNHRFINYDQGDWGSRYASTGCGPTALAMVIATETGNPRITPHTIGSQLSPRFWANGSGTRPAGFHAIAERYGIEESQSSFLGAEEALQSGGLAIVHAKPGHFTSAGHYMVLRSLSSSDRFRLADPNGAPGRDSEHRWWTAKQLKRDGIDDVWTFYPPIPRHSK